MFQGYLVVLCGTANICSICVTRTTRDIVLSFSNAFLFYGPFRGVTLISMHRNINVCDGGSIVRLVHSNICSIIISLHFFYLFPCSSRHIFAILFCTFLTYMHDVGNIGSGWQSEGGQHIHTHLPDQQKRNMMK